jgi:hypothetical protein
MKNAKKLIERLFAGYLRSRHEMHPLLEGSVEVASDIGCMLLSPFFNVMLQMSLR